MNRVQSFSRKSFIRIFIIMMLMALFLIAPSVWIGRIIFANLSVEILRDISRQSTEMASGLAVVLPILDMLKTFLIPVVFFTCVCGALIIWLMVRRLFMRSTINLESFTDHNKTKGIKSSQSDKQASLKQVLKDLPLPGDDESRVSEKKEDIEFKQRLYLHMISVLQRDGRLLDFLSENLNNYEDHQIGAAVRNIHENCKNALNKYLNPIAVIDKNEGDEVVVSRNFDVNSIKLTGNVVNDPPFQGVLRHKGWQVTRLELPTLTPGQNPRIIAPAEVEIL
jgi:hypothetical protein